MTRRETDMAKLINAGFKVEPINESVQLFVVYFDGPLNSLYSGGVWKVYVELKENYPTQSPSLHFVTPIYHPNIHIPSGEICVNLLDAQWNPECELATVFNYILPQLLMQPNASDPINKEAGKLLRESTSAYEEKVIEYRDRYARPGQGT